LFDHLILGVFFQDKIHILSC